MGLDADSFIDIHESLKCPICLDVLDDPATAKCGHTCCYYCWYRLAASSGTTPRTMDCPICREEYTAPSQRGFSTFVILMGGKKLINNYIAKSIIDDSLTRCHWPGCTKDIKFRDRDRHTTECRHRSIPILRPGLTTRIGRRLVSLSIDTIDCPRCSEGFETWTEFNHHMFTVHDASEEEIEV